MQRLREKMAGRPFRILAVNVKQEASDVRRFVDSQGFNFTVLLDPWGQEARRWKVQIYPTSFLIDPQGRIQYRAYGAIPWDEDEALTATEGLMSDGPSPEPPRVDAP